MRADSDKPLVTAEEEFGRLAEQVARALDFGRLPEATQAVARLLKMAPESTTAHELHGDVLRAQGNVQAAREAYRKSMELEPANADAERKYAELTLQVAETQGDRAALLAGDLTKFRGAPHKDPGGAAARSLIFPGLGQLYNGDFELGLGLAVAALVLLVPVLLWWAAPLVEAMLVPMIHRTAEPPGVGGWLSLVALIGVYGYSAVEAYRTARARGSG